MTDVEIELRGGIPNGINYENIVANFKSKFNLLEQSKELVIFFKYGKDVRFKYINGKVNLVLKEKIGKDSLGASLNETIVELPSSQLKSVLKLMSAMGYEEGLLSLGSRSTFETPVGQLCFKETNALGDFFEIDRIVETGENTKVAEMEMNGFLQKNGLSAWSKQEYKTIRKKSLENLIQVSILDVTGNIHPQIIEFLGI